MSIKSSLTKAFICLFEEKYPGVTVTPTYASSGDLQTQIEGMKNHVKVCHGDFNPSNVIITSDNVPYIIDWAHVTQGNASADAARTYLLYCLNGDKETAEQYLDLFCKKSGIDKRNIQKYFMQKQQKSKP